MKMKKLAYLVAGLVLLSACSAAPGGGKGAAGGGNKQSGDTIKIGVNLELSGGVAAYGSAEKNGVELAAEQINKDGGILGKKVKLVVKDNKSDNNEGFYQDSVALNQYKKIKDDYFSHLIAVSFSIFDPFTPNKEEFKNYSYIGLKASESELKGQETYFQNDFLEAFYECISFTAKKARWLRAIKNLESDNNFAEKNLGSLMTKTENEHDDEYKERIRESIHKLSSGHASVLLIITQLVAKVEEKTLVLIDEPEIHLHPPLLSAFIRTLSDLLDNRNGVAIIATHSPVVLQEIPKSCVLKIERTGKITEAFRPNIETFGENVGVLTREVFGLEVLNSGFYDLLTKKVETGKKYNEIIDEFKEQLGTEARILLKMLVRRRDAKD